MGSTIIQENLKPCKACICMKGMQNNLNEGNTSKEASMLKRHVYQDLAMIKTPDDSKIIITKAIWQFMVDKYSGFKTSNFFKTNG